MNKSREKNGREIEKDEREGVLQISPPKIGNYTKQRGRYDFYDSFVISSYSTLVQTNLGTQLG